MFRPQYRRRRPHETRSLWRRVLEAKAVRTGGGRNRHGDLVHGQESDGQFAVAGALAAARRRTCSRRNEAPLTGASPAKKSRSEIAPAEVDVRKEPQSSDESAAFSRRGLRQPGSQN